MLLQQERIVFFNIARNHLTVATYGDEVVMLAYKHRDTFFCVNPRRDIALKSIQNKVQLAILDDGMQHLRLERDIDIVVIDCTIGFGNEKLLPLGPLREPLNALKRADCIVFTKTNLATNKDIQYIKNLLPIGIPIYYSSFIPSKLTSLHTEQEILLSFLKNKEVNLFTGIANPKAFYKILQTEGAIIQESNFFPDHYNYRYRHIEKYLTPPYNVFPIIITEKDQVKLLQWKNILRNFYVLKAEMNIEESFTEWLNDKIDSLFYEI